MKWSNLNALLKLPGALEQELELRSRQQAAQLVRPLVDRMFGAKNPENAVRYAQHLSLPKREQK